MKYTPKRTYWINDSSGFGFACLNIFDKPEGKFDLMDAIHNGLFNEENFGPEDKNIVPNSGAYGPLKMDKIEPSDFLKVNEVELKYLFEKFCNEGHWGKDLDVFKSNKWKIDADYLNEEIKAFEHYFICKTWLKSDKLIAEDFFCYLVCVISVGASKIALFSYGED